MVASASCGRTRRTSKAATWLEAALALALGACSGDAPAPPGAATPAAGAGSAAPDRAGEAAGKDSRGAAPRTARADVREELLADLAAARHPSDGGGRAWLEPPAGAGADGAGSSGGATSSDEPPDAAPAAEGLPAAVAGASGSWRIVFEAGAHGVAAGGAVFLQVSPFWGWSAPQVLAPDAPGFTRVSTAASGVLLEPRAVDQGLLAARIAGRALAPGERIVFEYGAGPARARGDDYAERCSRFWLAVDGDGDGVRGLLADAPCVEVLPGPAGILSAVAPTVLRPGEAGRLHVALLDAEGNAFVREDARVRFEGADAALGLPEEVELSASAGALAIVALAPAAEGTFRFRALARTSDGRELACDVGPLVVSAQAARVLWADLHGHSAESDGTGAPEDWWRYARDVAGLDAAALTDHDHWGMRFLDRAPDAWRALEATARAHDVPGRFVALHGYEYTDWIHGHRCVVWFEDGAELWSSLDERSDTPQELWERLRGKRVLTIPHHPAGGTLALDWSVGHDPELEPVVEIASVQGSSEAQDSGHRIRSPVPGNFARDALARGARFGFVGSGDSHDGHPGLAHLGTHYASSGLAAVVCEERTREALHGALRSRRVYATTGARILLRFACGAHPMGSIVGAAELGAAPHAYVSVVATAPIDRVEAISREGVVTTIDGEGRLELSASGELSDLAPGDFVYVRVVQRDGHMAWSSPVFVR